MSGASEEPRVGAERCYGRTHLRDDGRGLGGTRDVCGDLGMGDAREVETVMG